MGTSSCYGEMGLSLTLYGTNGTIIIDWGNTTRLASTDRSSFDKSRQLLGEATASRVLGLIYISQPKAQQPIPTFCETSFSTQENLLGGTGGIVRFLYEMFMYH